MAAGQPPRRLGCLPDIYIRMNRSVHRGYFEFRPLRRLAWCWHSFGLLIQLDARTGESILADEQRKKDLYVRLRTYYRLDVRTFALTNPRKSTYFDFARRFLLFSLFARVLD